MGFGSNSNRAFQCAQFVPYSFTSSSLLEHIDTDHHSKWNRKCVGNRSAVAMSFTPLVSNLEQSCLRRAGRVLGVTEFVGPLKFPA
jgi:hypothetical protein